MSVPASVYAFLSMSVYGLRFHVRVYVCVCISVSAFVSEYVSLVVSCPCLPVYDGLCYAYVNMFMLSRLGVSKFPDLKLELFTNAFLFAVLTDYWCGLLVTLVPWCGWFTDRLNFHMKNSADTNFGGS